MTCFCHNVCYKNCTPYAWVHQRRCCQNIVGQAAHTWHIASYYMVCTIWHDSCGTQVIIFGSKANHGHDAHVGRLGGQCRYCTSIPCHNCVWPLSHKMLASISYVMNRAKLQQTETEQTKHRPCHRVQKCTLDMKSKKHTLDTWDAWTRSPTMPCIDRFLDPLACLQACDSR